MTAPERGDGEAGDLLAKRLRAGFAIVLGVSLVFAAVDLAFAARPGALLAVKVLQGGITVAGLLALGRIRRGPRLPWLGAAVVGGVYVTSAVSAILRGEIVATSFIFVATAMATATFVPWGALPQLASVLVAAVSLAIDRVLLGEPGPEFVYRAIAVGVSFGGSVWVAWEHDRQRGERLRAEARLATESRVSAALARAGEEMIRAESMPAILDGLCRLTTELLDCDHADLVLRDPGEDVLALRASHGHSPAEWRRIQDLRLSGRLLDPLMRRFETEGAVVQADTADVADAIIRRLYEDGGIATSLFIPLRAPGGIAGVLSVHRRMPRRFDPADERVASGVAHLASLALANVRLLDELREANRLKSEFVSTMSHELRTPVSVILGYAEMLEEDLPAEERSSILGRVRRSGLELLDLIEETLNLSRLEAGTDPPRFESVDIRALFDELAAEFETLWALDGVTLRFEGAERCPVVTDPRKLRIILKNLLGNALKFTPKGEVVLACRDEGGVPTLVVRDTGVGIASEHLPIIFDMFRQADSSDARAYRGAGLGLHIVQRLVHQLGGEIHVESQLGRGSSFRFTLPQPAAPDLSPASSAAEQPTARTHDA